MTKLVSDSQGGMVYILNYWPVQLLLKSIDDLSFFFPSLPFILYNFPIFHQKDDCYASFI